MREPLANDLTGRRKGTRHPEPVVFDSGQRGPVAGEIAVHGPVNHSHLQDEIASVLQLQARGG